MSFQKCIHERAVCILALIDEQHWVPISHNID